MYLRKYLYEILSARIGGNGVDNKFGGQRFFGASLVKIWC